MFVSYGETDDFAHDGEYDAYLKSAQRTDTFIKKNYGTLRNKTLFTKVKPLL